ncbi:MAG: glycerophosphodiester phosphodiesterase family protein [Thermoproteota archaeon]
MSKWEERVLVLGHRGFMAKYPENTLLSFLKAVEAGGDGVELDVWLSRDEHPIIMHDESIDRTSNLKGRQKEMTIEELKKAELGMGQKIPTLEEVFEKMPPNTLINIELKDIDATEKSVEVIHRFGAENRVLISSFNIETLKKVRSVDKEMKLGLIYGFRSFQHDLKPIETLNLYSINIPIEGIRLIGLERLKKFLASAKSFRLEVALWSGNDNFFYENDNLKQLSGMFKIVIPNDVERMIKHLRNLGLR